MQNQELLKITIEEFSRVQQWLFLAEKGSNVYEDIKIRYTELKVLLMSMGVNIAELDKIKE